MSTELFIKTVTSIWEAERKIIREYDKLNVIELVYRHKKQIQDNRTYTLPLIDRVEYYADGYRLAGWSLIILLGLQIKSIKSR